MSKIYFVQEVKYYGYDDKEDENIEECLIIGYFSSLDIVEKVVNLCIENGLFNSEIVVKSFDVDLKRNKKYVYVITHDYSIREENGTFTDYEYIFEPKSSRAECEALKCKLKELPKYKYSQDRDYSITPPDGFYISRYKINQMVCPIVKYFS